MAAQRSHLQIIHAGAFQGAVGEVEAGRLDDMDDRAETGGKAQDRASISRYIRLIERDFDGFYFRHGSVSSWQERSTVADWH